MFVLVGFPVERSSSRLLAFACSLMRVASSCVIWFSQGLGKVLRPRLSLNEFGNPFLVVHFVSSSSLRHFEYALSCDI